MLACYSKLFVNGYSSGFLLVCSFMFDLVCFFFVLRYHNVGVKLVLWVGGV